jgi:hypothetical protein
MWIIKINAFIPSSTLINSSSPSLEKSPSYGICHRSTNMGANLLRSNSYHVPQYLMIFTWVIDACENNHNLVLTQIPSQYPFICATCILKNWILHLAHDSDKLLAPNHTNTITFKGWLGNMHG